MEYGFISLLPVLVILIIAVATKRTLFAMTCGLTVGAIILASANEGFVNSWFGYLYASMANESFQWIAMVVAMFGMLIVLFERSNAVTDFGILAGKIIKHLYFRCNYFLRRLFEQFGSRYDDEGHYRQTGHSENTACLCRKRGRRAGLYSDPAFILGGIFRDADGKPRRCG